MREHRVRLVAGETVPHELAPGATLPERSVRARNLFRDAANRIHDDAGARQHGYAGALVAGVTIYGYLARVAVETLGVEWLRRGTATVRFARPVYDGDLLALSGRIVGAVRAETAGEVVRRDRGARPSRRGRGDPDGGPGVGRARPRGRSPRLPRGAAARIAFAGDGGGARQPRARSALRPLLLDAAALAQAADDLEDPSPGYRGAEAVAHPGLLLRQANRALSENVALGPWIHVSSDVAHCGSGAGRGPARDARPRRARLYERKGRGWVDLDLLIVAGGARPIARIRHTAIYRMSAPGRARGPARRHAMSDVAYVSKVRIERIKGPLRRAYLPEEPAPVLFGVHGAVAKHYGVDMEGREAHATTLDYVVAAAAG